MHANNIEAKLKKALIYLLRKQLTGGFAQGKSIICIKHWSLGFLKEME